jgi:hypothetical protein
MKNAPTTENKLLHWGFTRDVKCAFCRSVIEDRDHLFFECGVAKRIWTLVMQNCGVLNPPIRWEDVISVGLDHWKKKTLQANICRLEQKASFSLEILSLCFYKRRSFLLLI